MAKQDNISMQETLLSTPDATVKTDATQTAKKQFIEPEISAAVDVLEATTFFQAITSGATN